MDKRIELVELEKRILELEAVIQRVKIGSVAAFSAGDCTNGCTDACTRGCTNGCTGSGCLLDPVKLEEIARGGR